MPTGGTYAFADVAATYTGPFGIIDFTDCGTTDEGISVEFDEDKGLPVTGRLDAATTDALSR